ncbi:MAG: hypothetical protein KA346_10920 [Neisseriaceae bacterium]|nr:hypothetical protein [Neisseriaceae bacterium]
MLKKILFHPIISLLVFVSMTSMILTINKYTNISYQIINDVEIRPRAFTIDKYNLIVNKEIIGVIFYESWQINNRYLWGRGLYLPEDKNLTKEHYYFIDHLNNTYVTLSSAKERKEFMMAHNLPFNGLPLETIQNMIQYGRKYDEKGHPLMLVNQAING